MSYPQESEEEDDDVNFTEWHCKSCTARNPPAQNPLNPVYCCVCNEPRADQWQSSPSIGAITENSDELPTYEESIRVAPAEQEAHHAQVQVSPSTPISRSSHLAVLHGWLNHLRHAVW